MLLRVPVADDPAQYIEVEIDARDYDDAVELVSDVGDRVLTGTVSLAAAFRRLLPAVNQIMTSVRQADQAPDEISVEFNLKLGGQTGLIFTKGTAEATFAVKIGWKKPPSTESSPEPAGPGAAA